MTEDTSVKASDESVAASAAGRQRKKRKWDQPAEHLISTGIANYVVPLQTNGTLGVSLPGAIPLSGSPVTNLITTTLTNANQSQQPLAFPHHAAVIVQKLIQPKIQDEIIAREIVINDAEPTVRYKLTKRQTQEEIQKCTGAVVITRGKYRPPNGLLGSDKPLYLHISAGTHLKDTAERIKAVDCAAAMVEEILKQGQSLVLNSGQISQPASACVYLGFDADPSLNIVARIRGPNDQYINHIMNETGATVLLRGLGSGYLDSSHSEEALQPLHLYLSSTNPQSLEHARILAENLLDTISVESSASRISSSKAYSAVPPPQQLLAGVESSGKVLAVKANPVSGLPCGNSHFVTSTQSFTPTGVPLSTGSTVCPPSGTTIQPGSLMNYGNTQNVVNYATPSVTGGTCYDGYGGIYPQATPLQQVALALRQAPSSTASVVSSTTSLVYITPKPQSTPNGEADKRPPHKRKFQELPVTSKGPATLIENSRQGSKFLKAGSENSDNRAVLSMPPPKRLVESGTDVMPLSSRTMPPLPPKFSSPQSPPKVDIGKSALKQTIPESRKMPPPPPKFPSSELHPKVEGQDTATKKFSPQPVSDTLMKLVEYGDDDDDIDGVEDVPRNNPTQKLTPKPFWAV